jgi:hypothetical protein
MKMSGQSIALTEDVNSTSAVKKATFTHPAPDASFPTLEGRRLDLDALAAKLKYWVQSHSVLHHPIFDYLETTAQLPELSVFVEAEINEERRLRTLAASCAEAPFRQGTAVSADNPGDCDSGYGLNCVGSLNAIYSETYLALLQRTEQQLPHFASQVRRSSLARSNAELFESVPIAGFAHGFNISAIKLVVRNIQLHQWDKLLRGCVRLGIISSVFPAHKDDAAMTFIENNIETVLHNISRARPLLAIDWARSIPIFMDWKTDYYDSLFSKILLSL